MKSIFKKIVGIGLLCFASLMYASDPLIDFKARYNESVEKFTTHYAALENACSEQRSLGQRVDNNVLDRAEKEYEDEVILLFEKELYDKKMSPEQLANAYYDIYFNRNGFNHSIIFPIKKIAKIILESSFDYLESGICLFLIHLIGLRAKDRMGLINRLLKSRIEEFNVRRMRQLFDDVIGNEQERGTEETPSQIKNKLAVMILEKFFHVLKYDAISVLIKNLIRPEDKIEYVERLLRENKCGAIENTLEWVKKIASTMCAFSDEESIQMLVRTILEKDLFEQKHDVLVVTFFLHMLPGQEAVEWYKKLFARHALLSTCIGDGTVQGPMFSQYAFKHISDIGNILIEIMASKDSNKMEYARGMLAKIRQFTLEEYRKDNLVLYHGQHDQWKLLRDIWSALLEIKYGRVTPDNYVPLRFSEKKQVSDFDVTQIRRRGMDPMDLSADNWNQLLFMNLHLFANEKGSNSLEYIFNNYDQTVKQKRFNFDAGVKAQFVALGMLSDYEKLTNEQPELFKMLYDTYKQDVVARGDIGTLLAISMPKDIARKLCYSSGSGGVLNVIDLEGTGTIDAVELAEKYASAPFKNQICAVMTKELTDPFEAAKAGINMISVTTDPTEQSIPFAQASERNFIGMKERVAELYYQRTWAQNGLPLVALVAGSSAKKQRQKAMTALLYPGKKLQESDYTLVD